MPRPIPFSQLPHRIVEGFTEADRPDNSLSRAVMGYVDQYGEAAGLTRRQTRVMALVYGAGHSRHAVARMLRMDRRMIQVHIKNAIAALVAYGKARK